MPAPLSEVIKGDTENYFIGESYQKKLFPSKSIGAALMRTQRQAAQAQHQANYEGFSGDGEYAQVNQFVDQNNGAISTPGPSRLALLKPGPEPLQSSSQFGQVFHPIDLTATNQGGLSAQMEKELEMGVENVISCPDAMGHFKKCKTCREKAILELTNLHATSESMVLGGEEGLRNLRLRKKKNELSELVSLAGAGVFTIFLIDAFSKFGARLRG